MAGKKNGGEATTQTGSGGAAPAGGKVSKTDAVGQALAELGQEASRVDIQAFVRDRYGYEMSLDHISNCKGDLRKRAGQKKKPGPKPGTRKPQAARQEAAPTQGRPARPVAAAARASATNGASIPLEDILVVKSLVERVGAGNLRTLIAAFER